MRTNGWKRRMCGGAALTLAGGLVLVTPVVGHHRSQVDAGGSPSDLSLAAATQSWTVYHGNSLGTGVDTSGVTFSPPSPAWTSAVLDGQIYGEPLESGGRVFVATENDTVYALAANTGAELWSSHVGTTVPSGDLPCGDISPDVGITGTPVIDENRGEIFAVADELVSGVITHHLVGINVFNGNIELNQAISLPGSDQAAQLQRTGLNLSNGNVVFGFGGNYGDCGNYHGWIVAVPEGGGSQLSYEVDSSGTEREGAIWMGGAAPEVDGSGNIWAAAGNGSVTTSSSPYDFSDSVFELSPALARLQYFAPSSWASDNAGDADLGSSAPAMISNGTVLQIGKSQTAFKLNQSHLGGIGGQVSSIAACGGNDVDGGDAVNGTVVYIPCRGGVQAIETSPSLGVAWTAASGSNGPPIMAGGLVWSIKGSTLYGINPANGQTSEQVSVGGSANHFPTPSVGDGLLLAPSTDQIYAFSGSAGVPGPPTPPPPPAVNSSYWLVAADGGIFTFGNAGYFGSMGGKHLNQPVVGMATRADHDGYWLVASDGGIFNFGGAGFFGSTGGRPLNARVVGMAATPSGNGYWLVAADGGVFNFGDAPYLGSKGGQHINEPMVGMAAEPHGNGYWLVASDGGIFNFGPGFFGSEGGRALNQPVVGMASTPSGAGYWLVASDGGIFNLGDANFSGSEGATPLNKPVVGMASAS